MKIIYNSTKKKSDCLELKLSSSINYHRLAEDFDRCHFKNHV